MRKFSTIRSRELLSFHDEFRSNNNRVQLLFSPLLARGQFPLRVKVVSLQCISYLPSSPLEMFFQQFDSKFRWIKRREGRGGSIAGGDINGPRNFSPKEKINTSYYAPFAFLLRVCSCESIEAWDVGKKVFFPVWFFFFLAFFFSLPLGRESGE